MPSLTPQERDAIGYLRWRRLTHQRELAAAAKEAARQAKRDEARAKRAARLHEIAAPMHHRLDLIERHPPTHLAVQLLSEMAVSRKVPADVRVRASALLLKFANGEFNHGRRKGKRD